MCASTSSIEIETERKFLLRPGMWPKHSVSDVWSITQWYIAKSFGNTIRVRKNFIHSAQSCDYVLEGKGPRTGISQPELPVPLTEEQCTAWATLGSDRVVSKDRNLIPGYATLVYEVDVFLEKLLPLEMVEVEFGANTISPKDFVPPDWFSMEVTHMPEYANYNLAINGLPPHYAKWLEEQSQQA